MKKIILKLNFAYLGTTIVILTVFLFLTLRTLMLYNIPYDKQKIFPFATIFLSYIILISFSLFSKIESFYSVFGKKVIYIVYSICFILIGLTPLNINTKSLVIISIATVTLLSTLDFALSKRPSYYVLIILLLLDSQTFQDFLYITLILIVFLLIDECEIMVEKKDILKLSIILTFFVENIFLKAFFFILSLCYIIKKMSFLPEIRRFEEIYTTYFLSVIFATYFMTYLDVDMFFAPYYAISFSYILSKFFFDNLKMILRVGFAKENPQKYIRLNKVLLFIVLFLVISKLISIQLYYFASIIFGIFSIYYLYRIFRFLSSSLSP